MKRILAAFALLLGAQGVTATSPPPDFEVFTLYAVGDKATSKDGISIELKVADADGSFGFVARKKGAPTLYGSVLLASKAGANIAQANEWQWENTLVTATASFVADAKKSGVIVSVSPVRNPKPLSFDEAAEKLLAEAQKDGQTLSDYHIWSSGNRVEFQGREPSTPGTITGGIGKFSQLVRLNIPKPRGGGSVRERVYPASVQLALSGGDEEATKALLLREAPLRRCAQALAGTPNDAFMLEFEASRKGSEVQTKATKWPADLRSEASKCFELVIRGAFGGRKKPAKYSVGYAVGPVKSSRQRPAGVGLAKSGALGKVEKVRVVPGRPAVEGKLDREIVVRVVRLHQGELEACYKTELAANPARTGGLMLHLVVAATGTVVQAFVDPSPLGKGVDACVAGAARKWKFPEPTNGMVRIDYPVEFSR